MNGIKTKKRLIDIALSFAMTAAVTLAATTPAFASEYVFGTGGAFGGFGTATSYDEPITPDLLSQNTRRNKDAAYNPPYYGTFSGDIPTDPSSVYHYNLPDGGFMVVTQNLPPTGAESYAPSSGSVSSNASTLQAAGTGAAGGNGGLLPSTSQTASQNIVPWYYDDGSIGALFVERTGKTIKVYEGESLENLKKGAGHFSYTSAWDGNVAVAGHNRGSSGYFDFVKDAQNGDKLTFTTRYGTRTYEVFSKVQINEYDSLPLSWSGENVLTLITCVADIPELRYCISAREVR